MTAHPNALILALLAEIAKTDDRPWKLLEMKNTAGGWVDCGVYASILHPEAVLRIKPTTVNIGGVELEGPLRAAPENGSAWLLFDPTQKPEDPLPFTSRQASNDRWLKEGRLFATKEARDKYQNALVKLAMGETK